MDNPLPIETSLAALSAARFYGILDLDYTDAGTLEEVVSAMLSGGIQLIQIRAKNHPPSGIAGFAHRVHPLTADAGVPLILNDHPHLLAEIPAEGVHVGQDDLPVAEARRIAGRPVLAGKSTHSVAQALASMGETPDYIGFGPLFATPTKPDYPAIGTDDIRTVRPQISVPVFCIGGIKRENLDTVLAAGAERVVIVSGVLQAPDIAAYCREVRARLG